MPHLYNLVKSTDMPYSPGVPVWYVETELPEDYDAPPIPGLEIRVITEDLLPQPLYYNYKTDAAHGVNDPFLRYVRVLSASEIDFYSDTTIAAAMGTLNPVLANLLKFMWGRLYAYPEAERLEVCTEALEALKAALSNQSN